MLIFDKIQLQLNLQKTLIQKNLSTQMKQVQSVSNPSQKQRYKQLQLQNGHLYEGKVHKGFLTVNKSFMYSPSFLHILKLI